MLRDDHAMRHIVVRSPMGSCKKIRAALRLKGMEISLSTVSRCLGKEFGLKSRKPARKPARKPCLTPVMKKETGLCQTTSPLDSHAVEESVVLR